MNIRPAERLSHFETGIFAALNAKKNALIAQGRPVYNLSVGTPDFQPAPHVMEAVSKAAMDPIKYKYSLCDLPELKQAVCDYYARRFGVEIAPNEVTSVHGSQEGLGHIGMALCNPGDVALLPNPGYPIFEAGSYLAGAELKFYPLTAENGFLPDLTVFDEDTLRRARYIIVSYPSNPVGAVAPKSMYEELIRWAKQHDVIIINDNAYSDIIYDGNEGYSFLSIPGAKDVGVEFFSLSKSFNLTGARVSFVVGNPSVVAALDLLRTQYDFGMFYPVQMGAIAALTGPLDAVQAQKAQYQARRDALCGGLREIGWNVPDCKGTMFVWAPIPQGYADDLEFCDALIEKAGVIVTPGSSFGSLGKGYVRFALVQPPERLAEIVGVIRDSGVLKQ